MAFFMFTFIAGSMISFSMEGGSGVAATTLTDQDNVTGGYQKLGAADTTIAVVSVRGFLPGGDRLTIEKESILYTGVENSTAVIDSRVCPCLTGVVRGSNDYTGEETTAASHKGPVAAGVGSPPRKGTKVYNRGSSVVNQAIGFNIGETSSVLGKFKAGFQLPGALVKLVIKLVAWDFAFLEGNYVYFKYLFLYPISAGFVWTVISMGGTMAMSILKRG